MPFIGNKPSAVPLTSADIADGIITTAKIADGNITSTKILDGTILNADINASAAIVSTKLSGVTIDIKAWVQFNGTTNFGGDCSINGSRNVSSVLDNGTGDYSVNFTTAISDANYAFLLSAFRDTTDLTGSTTATTAITTKIDVSTFNNSNARQDSSKVCVAILR